MKEEFRNISDLKKININHDSILNNILSNHLSIKYEIEARIGKIYNKETETRIKIDSLVPVIFKKLPKNHIFNAGVDAWDFKNLQKNLKFSEHIKDEFRYMTNGNRLRFVNNEYRFCEKKKKVLVIDVYMPNYKYDVRISVMTEEKQMQRCTTSPVEFIRYRDRYTYSDKYFNYDFTKVRKNNEVTYEVEIEVEDLNYNIDEFMKCFTRINVEKE